MPILKDHKPAGQPNPLNAAEKAYVLEHYQSMTVAEMGKSLHRDMQIIYRHMKAEGLPTFNMSKMGLKHPREVKDGQFFDEQAYARNNII